MKPFRLIIDGRKVPTGRFFEVLNPANEKVAGLASLARKKDLDDAVGAAWAAFKKWREVPEAKRQAACLRIASKIEENAEELARILTAEQGKPLNGLVHAGKSTPRQPGPTIRPVFPCRLRFFRTTMRAGSSFTASRSALWARLLPGTFRS
jgi:hypothetical protein